MFGIGSTELAIILLFAFLVLGPDKLPEFAKVVGRAIAKFRDVQDDMNNVVQKEFVEPVRKAAADETAKKNKATATANLAKSSTGAGPGATPVAGADSTGAGEEAPHEETFTERKARYDRERAERRARQLAEREAQKAAEAEGERAQDAAADAEPARPAISAEELYGIPSKPEPQAEVATEAAAEAATETAAEASATEAATETAAEAADGGER